MKRLLLAAALIVITGMAGFTGAAPADVGDPTDSAVTVPGTGEFANLRVSVNQTSNLINQIIKVSWTGGTPTPGGPTTSNFLQIMQCWGDDPGPDRTQCQFGAVPSNDFQLESRHLLNAHNTDPQETLNPQSDRNYVPYWAPGEPRPTGLIGNVANPYLDAQLTNEAPRLRTRPNGTGEEFFEVQTFRQNAGLDCGKAVGTAPAVTGKACWLVIVPRGTTEVDGKQQAHLESSPLSKTNWDKRIQIKLDFLPVEQTCQIGAAERPVRGHETVVEAVSRWQPALCANGGKVFSYTQYSDELARSALGSTSPALQILSSPLPAEQESPERPVLYAPVALSGLAFAFNIEYQPFNGKENEHAGTRFAELKLTARLVAKLLTQSYKSAVANENERAHLGKNPTELTRDPDFLAHNPEYKDQDVLNRISEPILAFGTADVVAVLWAWVLGDAEARAFLSGTPDPWEMVVNPHNKGITEPVPVFPRNDPGCELRDVFGGQAKACTGDLHPVASDMHEAGRSAGRGDIYSRAPIEVVPGNPPIVKYARPGRAGAGGRSVIAVVDTATAARYGLRLAKLRNAAGQFVAPTSDGLRAGLIGMKPGGATGVLRPDPSATDAAAYPLTTLSYAATAPSAIDAAAGADYAEFLTFVAGPGQEPGDNAGQLPQGYEPLPPILRFQTVAVAAAIAALAGKPVELPTDPQGGPGGSFSGSGTLDGGSVPAGMPASGDGPGAAATTPPPASSAAPTTTAAPGRDTAVVTKAEPTPAVPAPAVWALIVGLLVCGAVAGALSPLAHFISGRRRDGGR